MTPVLGDLRVPPHWLTALRAQRSAAGRLRETWRCCAWLWRVRRGVGLGRWGAGVIGSGAARRAVLLEGLDGGARRGASRGVAGPGGSGLCGGGAEQRLASRLPWL